VVLPVLISLRLNPLLFPFSAPKIKREKKGTSKIEIYLTAHENIQ
jgi:hypothetical protein